MKVFKSIAIAILAVSFASCNDGKEDANMKLAQYYQVEFINGQVNCFANFYLDGMDGARTLLPSGSHIYVGNSEMISWTQAQSSDFSYSYQAPSDATSLVFKLDAPDGHTYTNSISRSEVSKAVIPSELGEIENDVPIVFPVDAKLTETVSLRLVQQTSLSSPQVYNIPVAPGDQGFTISNVPAGQYELRYIIMASKPLQAQMDNCGGIINLLSVSTAPVMVK